MCQYSLGRVGFASLSAGLYNRVEIVLTVAAVEFLRVVMQKDRPLFARLCAKTMNVCPSRTMGGLLAKDLQVGLATDVVEVYLCHLRFSHCRTVPVGGDIRKCH